MPDYYTWSPDQQTRLADLVAAEFTFSQIATIFGISKNACVGKAYRMGLAHAKNPFLSFTARLDGLNIFPPKGHCVFPIGTPGDADFAFCGDKSKSDHAYCEQHYARAYIPESGMTDAMRQINFAASRLGHWGN